MHCIEMILLYNFHVRKHVLSMCRDMGFDPRARERSRSPASDAAPWRGSQRVPPEGHRAVFEDAVRRTGGYADAGAHPPNIKMEPGRNSPDVLIMAPPGGLKQEFGRSNDQGHMGGARHNRGAGERDLGSVVIMNVHFEVLLLFHATCLPWAPRLPQSKCTR